MRDRKKRRRQKRKQTQRKMIDNCSGRGATLWSWPPGNILCLPQTDNGDGKGEEEQIGVEKEMVKSSRGVRSENVSREGSCPDPFSFRE